MTPLASQVLLSELIMAQAIDASQPTSKTLDRAAPAHTLPNNDVSSSSASSSHAAGAPADVYTSPNWLYVECCRCRRDALTADPSTGEQILRGELNLTECGHVACNDCLKGRWAWCSAGVNWGNGIFDNGRPTIQAFVTT